MHGNASKRTWNMAMTIVAVQRSFGNPDRVFKYSATLYLAYHGG